MAACEQSDSGAPTATPERPSNIDAIYITPDEGALDIYLTQLDLLVSQNDPDTQVLVVLASGDANPSYVLYPSNQPGVPQMALDLTDYPLRFDDSVERVGLWAVALKHQAYPIAAALGQDQIAAQLARGFDQLIAQDSPPANPLAPIVAEADASLLAWFGEIEVLGEVALELTAAGGWSAGENQVQSRDGGLSMRYEVLFADAVPDVAVVTEAPTDTPTVGPTTDPGIGLALGITPAADDDPDAIFGDIEGYRQVVYENFDDAQSEVEWFIGRDPTYSATIVNNAYQIVLEDFERNRSTATIWGSIQGLIFDDYIVRARMRVIQEDVLARYGLWLHYQDQFNFLFFGMENTGRYRAARFQTGYTELSPWAEDDIVNPDNEANLLEVIVEGTNFTMGINGEALVTVSDRQWADGRIAFFCLFGYGARHLPSGRNRHLGSRR